MNRSVLEAVLVVEQRKLVNRLNRIGLMHRSFTRVKSLESMIVKDRNKGGKYTSQKAMITDCLGIRVTTYYRDDVQIVESIISQLYDVKDKNQVTQSATTFGPVPNNITVHLQAESKNIVEAEIQLSEHSIASCVDTTMEIQIRTIGSELWYEIEHKLRYKGGRELFDATTERDMNRVLAVLEQSEVALQLIAKDLAHKSHKVKSLYNMCAYHFRMDGLVDDFDEDDVFTQYLRTDRDARKELLFVDRAVLMQFVAQCKLPFDFTARFVSSISLLLSKVSIRVSRSHYSALTSIMGEQLEQYGELIEVVE